MLFLVVACSVLIHTVVLNAQSKQVYSFANKISLPGDGGYDYLSIDEVNRRLFVSHGTSVNIIDLNTQQLIGTIDSMKGVHGIAIANEVNKGFISDGKDNSVIAFDLTTFKKLSVIPLSGKKPDAIIFDPYSKKVFAFNGDSHNASVIDITLLKETGTVELNGAPEFAVSNGEGIIYNNLEDKSSLAVIDTKAMKVNSTFSLAPCGGPTGIALDKQNKRAFSVCRENKGMSVVDITNGKVVTTIPIGAGVDAVAYDASSRLIAVSNADATVTIIQQNNADDYTVIQTLQTTYRAKTLALDAATHTLYLSAPEFDATTKKAKPGTFSVYVYKSNIVL